MNKSNPERYRVRGGKGDCPRGQSELLGFFLIFSVVTLITILVTTTGLVALDNARDFQRTTNTEQAFTALAGNIEDVVYHGAPSRSTEIRLADAKLSSGEVESITVLDENGTDLARVEIQPIEYDSGSGTTIMYYSGALVRQDDGHSVMFREPDFLLGDEEVRLPVIRSSFAENGPRGGTTNVDVTTEGSGTDVLQSNTSVDNVTLRLSSSDVEAWTRYFEQFEDDGSITKVHEPEGDTVEVTIETNRVYVTAAEVNVSFG